MKLYLVPEGSAYAVEFGEETLRAEVGAGPARYRADFIGAAALVNASFILDQSEYEYLWAFYREGAGRGATPFQIDMLLDKPELTEYTAHFVGPPRLTSQRGLGYFVQAQLELVQDFNPDQSTDDQAIITAFEAALGV